MPAHILSMVPTIPKARDVRAGLGFSACQLYLSALVLRYAGPVLWSTQGGRGVQAEGGPA